MHSPIWHLVPKSNWTVRKVLVWLVVGPLNPLCWAVLSFIDGQVFSFAFAVSLTLVPCCVGGALGLLRLKHQPYTVTDLSEFVTAWTFLALVIYLPIFVCVGVFYHSPQAIQGLTLVELHALFAQLFSVLIWLPFAYAVGGVPTIIAGVMFYWVVRWILFERSTRQSATP